MVEYIEREAAIDAVKQNVPYAYHAVAITLASMIPAADVKPVVRGEWEKVGLIENTWLVSRCSACGAQTIDAGSYCPNCGADMRGENDDNG